MPGDGAYAKAAVDDHILMTGDFRHDLGLVINAMHMVTIECVPVQMVTMKMPEVDKAVIIHTQAEREIPADTMSIIGEAKARSVAGCGR